MCLHLERAANFPPSFPNISRGRLVSVKTTTTEIGLAPSCSTVHVRASKMRQKPTQPTQRGARSQPTQPTQPTQPNQQPAQPTQPAANPANPASSQPSPKSPSYTSVARLSCPPSVVRPVILCPIFGGVFLPCVMQRHPCWIHKKRAAHAGQRYVGPHNQKTQASPRCRPGVAQVSQQKKTSKNPKPAGGA